MNVGDPNHSSGRGVLANKRKSKAAEKVVRKSDGVQYCRSRVTSVEGRPQGNFTLEGET